MAQFEARLGKRTHGPEHDVWTEGLTCQDKVAERLRYRESGCRDDVVHEAATAGLSLVRTQRITGLGTTTIMRIPNDPRDRACSPS